MSYYISKCRGYLDESKCCKQQTRNQLLLKAGIFLKQWPQLGFLHCILVQYPNGLDEWQRISLLHGVKTFSKCHLPKGFHQYSKCRPSYPNFHYYPNNKCSVYITQYLDHSLTHSVFLKYNHKQTEAIYSDPCSIATSLKIEDHVTCPYMKQTAQFSFVYLQNFGKQMG
jgi:hypothetical protein